MISCPLCNGVCRGHAGQPAHGDDALLEFADSSIFSKLPVRGGLQPKEIAHIDGDLWIVKHDRVGIAHASLNEWLSMQLMKKAGFDIADYGLSHIQYEEHNRAALFVRYFDFMGDFSKQLISGLSLLRESPSFAYKIESLVDGPDKDEFDYAFDVEVETLTLFDAINVFKEAGVEDLDNVFKFYIAADLLNHTDCHLGNIGFIRDLKTGLTRFSPVYDVGNFGAYGDARTILSTSSETYDLDGEALQKLGRKCGVLDWQSIVSTMIKKIRRALPESLQAAQALPWLRDIEIPETKNLRGPSDLDEFFDVYSGSVSRSLDCLESNLQISDQNSKFGSFSAEFAGAIVLDRLSNVAELGFHKINSACFGRKPNVRCR